MIHFEIDGFPNLSLSPYKGKEGLIKWNIPFDPYIANFKSAIPSQHSFFISKQSWIELCSGSGWLPEDLEIYALIFCIAYDINKKEVYYRIRAITITKTDLNAAKLSPTMRTVNTVVYSSPVAFTSFKPVGVNCLKMLDDSDIIERRRINQEVDNWKNTVRNQFFQFVPTRHNEHIYIGDIVGKQRILDLFDEYPNIDGITLVPALFKNEVRNSPFIAFKVNADLATITMNGVEPLKCPPGSVNPCQNNEI